MIRGRFPLFIFADRNIIMWFLFKGGIAEHTCEYCKKGDIVGVKGRIQTSSYETEDGNKKYAMEVVAEKISFLSSKKVGEENGTN